MPTSVNLARVHVAQRSMPEDFMDSRVKVAVTDSLEVQFLFQQICVLVQRFNSVHETFQVEDDADT